MIDRIRNAQRPVLILGHGIRLANAVDTLPELVNHLGIPTLLSWAGRDLIDHPLVYGSAGIYGNRAANAIVQQADFVLAIGTRLALPQTGYDIAAFAPDAEIVVVDVDYSEAAKHTRFEPVHQDAGHFIRALLEQPMLKLKYEWVLTCEHLRETFPFIEAEHLVAPIHYAAPYLFMDRLQRYLKPDQVIVTDVGTALLCAHPVLRLRHPQRLITSTGLGEMGCSLPLAIGASFARDKGEVLCLTTDGGIMPNLHELQTIAHHRLPVKIVVFCNDGYGMIKQTQKALGHVRTSVDGASGLSCPNFVRVAEAFGLHARHMRADNADAALKVLQSLNLPSLLAVYTDPEQPFVPKVATLRDESGRLYSPPLDRMSPLLEAVT